MNWQERIIIESTVLAGKPTIRGTRLAVKFIIDLLAQGWSTEDIIENYLITVEDIRACVSYANEAAQSYPVLT